MSSVFEGVRIVGAGQTVYAKKSPQTVQRLLYDAGSAALRDAGLEWGRVDGLALTSFMLPPDNVATVAEHLGIEARFLFQGLYGGASGIIGMAHAARAIRDGACDVVVVAAADAFDVASHNETLDRFNGPVREFMSPQGFGGANGMFALHTRLYMERHGATREDFGRFCIGLRANALLNPNALFKVAAHDGGLPQCEADLRPAAPLRLRHALHWRRCDRPRFGAGGADPSGTKVRILASEEIHNYPANDPYSAPGGWEGFADRLYERAGCRPTDLHFAQLYDDYPVMCFVQLEGLQICPKGTAFEFVRSTDITTKGAFPLNTGGGQLSAGQAGAAGGMIGVYEGATQLLGRAGARQVKCKRGVVSGYGMVAYGRGLCSSAAVLERAD